MPRISAVAPMNHGRYGTSVSDAVLSAPAPSNVNTTGPMQHAEAANAAPIPATADFIPRSLRARESLLHARDRGHQIAEATGAARVTNVARAPFRRDVLPHAFDGTRCIGRLDLFTNRPFGLTEAVADQTSPKRFFLPHGHAQLLAAIAVAQCVEIHDVAHGVWAEPVVD